MKFTGSDIKIISEIFRDIGQVFLAGIVIGPLVIGQANWFTLLLGFMLSAISWYLSILFNNFTRYGSFN